MSKVTGCLIVGIVLLIVLLLYTNREHLNPYWHRTNCNPADALKNLRGVWNASDGVSTYEFISDPIQMNPGLSRIVGSKPMTSAEVLSAVVKYASETPFGSKIRKNDGTFYQPKLYEPGENFIRLNDTLRAALGKSGPIINMKELGKMGSGFVLRASKGGDARDIKYQFEMCLAKSSNEDGATGMLIKTSRPDRTGSYNFRVVLGTKQDELMLNIDNGDEYTIATRNK